MLFPKIGEIWQLINSKGARVKILEISNDPINKDPVYITYTYIDDPYKTKISVTCRSFMEEFEREQESFWMHENCVNDPPDPGLSVESDIKPKIQVDTNKKENSIKTCICSGRDLFNFGCRCGAFQLGDC